MSKTVFLPAQPRPVRLFVNIDEATDDCQRRGDCARFSLHGLFWSVPMELNVHQINHEVNSLLVEHDLRAFPSHLGASYQASLAY